MTPPQTPQTWTAAEMELEAYNCFESCGCDPSPEFGCSHSRRASMLRYAAASAERESALRAENKELKGDLDLRTQERDGAMRAAQRQFDALTAERQKAEKLREWVEQGTDSLNGSFFAAVLYKMRALGLAPAPTTGGQS